MKLKHKLMSGYAIALGVAGVGTLNGLWLSNHQYQEALTFRNQASIEQRILNQIQIDVLYTRPVKQLFPHLQSPEDFERESQALLAHLQGIKTTLTNYNTSDQSEAILNELPSLLTDYESTVDQVLLKTQTFVETVQPLLVPDAPSAASRQMMIDLVRSPEFERFIEFPDQLFLLNQRANDFEQDASLALQQAENLRTQVIAISLMISMAIASLLAWHLSRSIAEPLAAVTKTAQQVTRDENFDLRVSVNSDDEVGTVAIALNELISRVGTLLEQQRQSASMKELFQNEKMATLGKMVSEVAHEISNPVNFITANLSHAQAHVRDLLSLIHTYDQSIKPIPEKVRLHSEEIDRSFLETDLPKLLQSMDKGASRAKQIALSLRNFSRLDNANPSPVNLHTCLDDTLLILSGRFKQRITIQHHYGNLPFIEGYAGPLYQVFTNLIGNAIDALLEANTRDPKITITTEAQEEDVVVSITDNGPGIDPEHLHRIFEPLFTTKTVGSGTGLGLAISHQIVAEKHHGKLTCESTLGQGTTFAVTLPIHQTAIAC